MCRKVRLSLEPGRAGRRMRSRRRGCRRRAVLVLMFSAALAGPLESEGAEHTVEAALEACHVRALQQFAAGPAMIDIRLDADTAVLERYEAMLGAQAVDAVLSGTGTLIRGDRSAAIAFTCYLDARGRAVSFRLGARE